MSTIKPVHLVAAAGIALGLAGVGIAGAHAASTSTNPVDNIVNAIAQKFNLKVEDVQQVFNEQREQMRQQHQQAYQDRINQAVKDGKITQAQADKLIAKIKELEAQRPIPNQDSEKTRQERRSEAKQRRTDLEQWAKDNNIPLNLLPLGPGMGGHGRGMGMRMHNFDNDGDDATSAQSTTQTN